MKEFKVIIVDDEENARRLLSDMVNEIRGLKVVSTCRDADSAFIEIALHSPDIVLLDIQMPRKDGFVLVDMIRGLEKIPGIIFVTAYEQYTIKAIRAAAFDYLLKPVKKEELEASVKRFREIKEKEVRKNQIGMLLDEIRGVAKLKFNDRNGFNMIDPRTIICLKADGNYTEICMNGEQSLLISLNLGKIEEQLNRKMFCRISRSCIVNIDYLVRVDRKKMVCELKTSQNLCCTLTKPYLRKLESRLALCN